jgi:flavin reductase (DIM6/NTAB) family NADH-FMN oxidoreductase RutF
LRKFSYTKIGIKPALNCRKWILIFITYIYGQKIFNPIQKISVFHYICGRLSDSKPAINSKTDSNMINFEALFGISYGLYIVSSGNKTSGNGFISNTVFQVTAEPPQFAICCNKDNLTSEFIINTGAFVATILEIKTPADIFDRFGYKSGRDVNKMAGWNIRYSEMGIPIVLNHAVSYLEVKVENTIDVGSHWMFIGLLKNAEIIDNTLDPITYSYYRQVKKGVAPKNAPTYIDISKLKPQHVEVGLKQFKCSVCGYIYDEAEQDIKFADLPDDWTCPICGAEKEEFKELKP